MDRRAAVAVRRFGSFELDLEAERLLKNGRTIRIQPQPFRLLCLLTNRPGLLVTREEIQAALWAGDTFVDFDQGVNFAIKQVRDALGDSAEDSLYVQTVPKRGYRFLAPVETGPSRGTGHCRVGRPLSAEGAVGEHRRTSTGGQSTTAAADHPDRGAGCVALAVVVCCPDQVTGATAGSARSRFSSAANAECSATSAC